MSPLFPCLLLLFNGWSSEENNGFQCIMAEYQSYWSDKDQTDYLYLHICFTHWHSSCQWCTKILAIVMCIIGPMGFEPLFLIFGVWCLYTAVLTDLKNFIVTILTLHFWRYIFDVTFLTLALRCRLETNCITCMKTSVCRQHYSMNSCLTFIMIAIYSNSKFNSINSGENKHLKKKCKEMNGYPQP